MVQGRKILRKIFIVAVGVAFSSNSLYSSGIRCLYKAYPDFFCKIGANHLIDCSGNKWVYDEKRNHNSFQSKLNNPDLMDQMELIYPKGKNWKFPLPKNFDPGRVRYEPLFLNMYGRSAKEVEKNIVTIPWLPKFTKKTLRVTSVNGVADKLKKISSEIEKLPESIRKKVYKPRGSFLWRKIKGTQRKSTHSFGIAIDLFSPDAKSYWRFSKPSKEGYFNFKNNLSLDIVRIFEKYGFIWGGKWYHFDSIHFEYRPELLLESCE